MCVFEFCGGQTRVRYRLPAFDVIECQRCGIRSRDPLPTKAEMDAMYADPAYHAAGYFADQLSSQSAVSLPERGIYQDLLELVPAPAGSQRPLLDVGSGAGLFVRMAREAGWAAEGLELSAELAQRACTELGVPVHTADFLAWPGTERRYAMITMWDFLEHVTDPLLVLRKAADLLEPGGYLAVLTIDSSSLFNIVGDALYRGTGGSLRRPLELLYDRRHAFYFARPQLISLVEESGMRVWDQRHYRAHLGRWLSVEIPLWLRLGGDLLDWCSVAVGRQYRQLLIARKKPE